MSYKKLFWVHIDYIFVITYVHIYLDMIKLLPFENAWLGDNAVFAATISLAPFRQLFYQLFQLFYMSFKLFELLYMSFIS